MLESISVMAYRPDPAEIDRPLTKEDLTKRRRALAMLSVHSVRDMYREAYERCKMNGDSLPRAAAIQELVTVWKELWEWKRRRPTRIKPCNLTGTNIDAGER